MDEEDVDMHNSKMEKSEFEEKKSVKTFEKGNDNNPSLYYTEVIKSMDTGKEKDA